MMVEIHNSLLWSRKMKSSVQPTPYTNTCLEFEGSVDVKVNLICAVVVKLFFLHILYTRLWLKWQFQQAYSLLDV